MNFFSQKFKSKKFLGGGGGGGGVRGGGGVGSGDRWMDRRTGPKQFAPSISSKLGA